MSAMRTWRITEPSTQEQRAWKRRSTPPTVTGGRWSATRSATSSKSRTAQTTGRGCRLIQSRSGQVRQQQRFGGGGPFQHTQIQALVDAVRLRRRVLHTGDQDCRLWEHGGELG